MKDNIEIGHLSKFDAFRSNRYQVTDLKTLLKSIQKSLILELRPPKPCKLLNFFYDFCNINKNRQTKSFSSQLLSNSRSMTGFSSCPKSDRIFKGFIMLLGASASN